MTTTATRRAALACALLATSSLAAPSLAQTMIPPAPLPAVHSNVDANGVDVIQGTFAHAATHLSIGPAGSGGLSFSLATSSGSWRGHNFSGAIEGDSTAVTVSFGGDSERFTKSGSVFVSQQGEGSTLSYDGRYYTYTRADGTVIRFDKLMYPNGIASNTESAHPISIALPDGTKISIHYKTHTASACVGYPCQPVSGVVLSRIQSVTSNRGYQLKFSYEPHPGPGFSTNLTGVTAINNAVDYCDPSADSCTGLTQTWPSIAIASYGLSNGAPVVDTVTDALNGLTDYTVATSGPAMGHLTAVRLPGRSIDDISVSYDSNGRVQSVTRAGVTHSYAYADAGNVRTTTVTAPDASQRVYVGDISTLRLSSVRDELYRTTSYLYDAKGRPSELTAAEGNKVKFTYDARGNVQETRWIAKSGSGLADITTSAGFDASCANPKTCNQPNWAKDAAGNQTDYSYDSSHGGLLTVTAPAPTTGSPRPQTRFSYSPLQAYYKNSAGSIVASGQPIQMPTASSACQTLSICVGTADEVKTGMAYGPQTAGAANNLLPTTISSGSGDGALTATVSMGYDTIGNQISIDGPLAGAADTVRTRYDSLRRVVGLIGADPDGAGALKHRAQRVTYGDWGQVTKAERGTVNSQSDPDWTAFASLEAVETGYDANARPATRKLVAGGTTYSLTQTSYDALGRAECTAVRMNPAEFGSLPASACTLDTQGSFGPDRITKAVYSAAGQVAAVKTAVGTPEEANEFSVMYTSNGLIQSAKDGEGNKSYLEYDGHDRLAKRYYPHPTKGWGIHSSTDYEQLTYDSRGNVTQRRLRDGQAIGYGYDNLSRLTSKDVPNTAYYENDVDYSYDLLGRLTAAASGGASQSVAFEYDALGRVTEETSLYGAKAMQYDLAGRLTRLTWPDSFYVTYDYNTAGDMTAIKESGTVSLATFGYDNLGRRAWHVRGNGTSTNYGYDGASRLTSLSLDLGGTAYDQSVTFAYNPAGQMVSRTGSNDAYAFTGHSNANLTDTVNGLNQIVTTGSTSVTHDTRGNTTAIGSTSYGFTSENRMTNGGGTWLVYDALGRMTDIYPGPTTEARIDNLGSQIISELDNSNQITRRYIHGPGTDEPLVEYSGSGLTTKRWLHADERGSVVGWTDANGNSIQINRYDEYGKPQAGFSGRFGYTGQAWLPELGLSYYKARMYHPALGRFMQADPIGYVAGMNLYDYVQGDPVNMVDPLGLRELCYNYSDGSPGIELGDGTIAVVAARVCYDIPDFGGGDWGGPTGGGTEIGDGVAGDVKRKNDSICPSPGIVGRAADVLGKLHASSLTLAGLIAGSAGYLTGKAAGTNPSIGFGNNAIQFTGSPLNVDGRAFALGNVQVYGAVGPESSVQSYSGAVVNLGKHEEAHTYQSQWLGPVGYLLAHVGFGVGESGNPLEQAADRYASGESCNAF